MRLPHGSVTLDRIALVGLTFDESVLTDLHINELHFALGILGTERLGEAERLGVILYRFVEIGHIHADMVHHDDLLVRGKASLGKCGVTRNAADQKTCNKKSKTAHDPSQGLKWTM